MEKLKSFIKKHWAIIVWIATIVFDEKYGLSQALFDSEVYQSIFKIIGAMIMAYNWNIKNSNINKQNK